MYKTAVYTLVNNVMQKVTHLKQQKSRMVIVLKQHIASARIVRYFLLCPAPNMRGALIDDAV